MTVKTEDIKSLGEISGFIDNYDCPEISDSTLKQNLSVKYSLREVDDNILLSGSISGSLTLACCRCLNSFEYPVNLKLSQVYPATLEEINLEEEIRQQVILNTPLKPLCGAECRGLCPNCGKNLNTGQCGCVEERSDHRWDALKKLIK